MSGDDTNADRVVTFELESRPEAGQLARRALDEQLRDALSTDTLENVLVVVTELVNNSFTHGPGGPIRVRVTASPEAIVQGEVIDGGSGTVVMRDLEGPTGGGLGLRIVDELVDRWGVREGTTDVWFELSERSDCSRRAMQLPWL